MYRDARITRIYEGTNEINRMLIPARLLKQLPELFAEATRRPNADRAVPSTGPFAVERDAIASAKALAATLLGRASAGYGDAFKEAQEVQAEIADIMIEVYAAESAVARAEKLAADRRAALAADIVRVYVESSMGRIQQATRPVVAALAAGGSSVDDLAVYAESLVPARGIDAIAARRRIADAVIAAERFPF
jgi:hypothetical protein